MRKLISAVAYHVLCILMSPLSLIGYWLARLTAAGFDPGERTLFLWEGVTMYLDRAAVEDTLRKIASTAQRSVVAFDYFITDVLESRALYRRYGRATTKAAGEALKFGVYSTPPSRERLAELVRSCGLSLSDQRTPWPGHAGTACLGRVRDRDSVRAVGSEKRRMAGTLLAGSTMLVAGGSFCAGNRAPSSPPGDSVTPFRSFGS